MTIKELVAKMTLEEKAGMCSGKDFWHTKGVARLGIPEFMVTDGPHGLRKQADSSDHLGINQAVKATCFPTAVGAAASFDRKLMAQLGDNLSKEALAENVSVILGPAVNIKRSPLCGRNFEYMSEDPYLTGELSSSYINAVQANNVGVSIKHFAVNNQETRRMSISAEVDERTLREIYLAGFEKAVKQSKPWTVMCSYNRINGVFSSENHWLTTKVLRDEWGFNGYVMTDWGALNGRVAGLKAGIDLEMPSSGGMNDRKIVEAVKDGSLDEQILDTAVQRILNTQFKNLRAEKDVVYDRDVDHAKAREMAGQCMVLLKNQDVLPLDKSKKCAFIGEFAKAPRFQGGGSSHINCFKVTSAWDAAEDIDKVYAQGYDSALTVNETLLAEAVDAAKNADVAIVFAGLPETFESEGFDREHMDMPITHNKLIESVAAVNPNTIVVLHNGSPVTMPWLDKVAGVLEAYLGGEAVGGAVYDVLFGAVNPSAKLAETFPIALADNSSAAYFPGGTATVEYREGLYVGYRYFDKVGKPVLFPFGFGLSYTTFEYSNLTLSADSVNADDGLTATFTVKNVGAVDGAEIVQLYVGDKVSSVYRPAKELKGFDKVFLKAGEGKEISIVLDKRSFAFYNTEASDWQVETGEFDIMIGASSADIRLTATVTVQGDFSGLTEELATKLSSYYSGDIGAVSDDEFSALLGRELTPTNVDKSQRLTEQNCFLDAEDTKWGGRICKLVRKFAPKSSELGENDMIVVSVLTTPVRAMKNFAGGILDDRMVEGLLNVLNSDKVAKGFGQLFVGAFGILGRMKKGKKNAL